LQILPPTLLSLSTSFQFEEKDVLLLPKSLTDLELTIRVLQNLKSVWKASFPQHLEKLVLHRAPTVQMVCSLATLQWLTSLTVSWDFSMEALKLDDLVLPPHLRSLQIKCPLDAPKTFFRDLPWSLTALEVEQNSAWVISEKFAFPPNLELLALRSGLVGNYRGLTTEQMVEFVLSLPKNLKTFDFEFGMELPFEAITCLPPNLTRCRNFIVDPNFDMADYPKKLRDFSSTNGPSISQLRWLTGQTIQPDQLLGISSSSSSPSLVQPMSLSYMELSGAAMRSGFVTREQAIACFKPLITLRTLIGFNINSIVSEKNGNMEASLAETLPSSLEYLNMFFSPLYPLSFDFGVDRNAFPALTHLSMRSGQYERLPIIDSLFPPSLRTLRLLGCSISLRYIQNVYLPHLSDLKLYYITDELRADHVKLLPRRLVSLNLHGPSAKLNLSDLVFMPESLTYLEIPDSAELIKCEPSKLPDPLSSLPLFLANFKITYTGKKSGPSPLAALIHNKREAPRQFVHYG
jgi:hypothetical protein